MDIPARQVLVILGFFGFVIILSMRVNLSIAMIAMVQDPHNPDSEQSIACLELIDDVKRGNISMPGNRSGIESGEFDWNLEMQANILSSFFYGYIITQIPGGIIAEKYGAKWLFGVGVLIASVFTLLTPVAARWSPVALFTARVIIGLAQGVSYPSMNVLIGRWAPTLERSQMASIIFNGGNLGIVLTTAGSGLLSASHFMGGWPSVFYIFGILGCVWFVLWTALVYESPETHPRISQKELMLIREGKEHYQDKESTTPWRAILTSKSVWGLVFVHFGQNWGYYTLFTEFPTYVSNVLHFDIKVNGFLSALPYLASVCFAIPGGFLADRLRAKGRYSITFIRKLFNTIAFFVPGVCFILVVVVGCKPLMIVVIITLSMGFNGLISSGYKVTHVDMSPQFSGTLMGLTNFIAKFSGFLAPIFVGKIIGGGQTLANWSIIFYTSSAVYFVTGILYNVFCTSELQEWDPTSPQPAESRCGNNPITVDPNANARSVRQTKF